MANDQTRPVDELVREVTSLRQRVAELEAAESELVQVREQNQQRAVLVRQVSGLAIELVAGSPDTDPCVLVAEGLKAITGALAVGVSLYDAGKKTLAIQHVAVDDSILAPVKEFMGQIPVGMQIPVSEELYQQMLAEVVSMEDSVAETFFGVILGPQADAVYGALGIDRFTGLSLHDGDELVGRAVFVLRQDHVLLPEDVLQIIAHIAAVSFRRRLAEDALRENEELYRRLVETSPDGIVVMDLQARILMANKELAKLYGCKNASELIGRSGLEFVPLKERQRALEGLQGLRDTRVVRDSEYVLQKEDGSTYPAVVSASLIGDSSDNPRAIIGVVRDISLRKQMEGAMQRRSRELELLNLSGQALNASLDLKQVLDTALNQACTLFDVEACSVWLIDPATGDLVCRSATGPHADLILGWQLAPGEGLAGWVVQSGKSLIVPDMQADERHFRGVEQQSGAALRSALNVPMRIKDEVIGVLQVLHGVVDHFEEMDQTIVESLATSAAIALENARLYEDLQARMAELRDAQSQLIQSAKMAAIGSLAAGVAHEINTPLTTVLGFSDLLLERAGSDAPDRRQLEAITRQAGRARDIVQDLLDFARQAEFHREPADPNEIIKDTLGLVRRQLETNGVTLEEHYATDLPTLMLDRARMKQVLLNLVTNALYAMPDSGVLTVRSERVADEVALRLSDTGRGISPGDTQHIFEPFFTTKPVGEGTGLGLSVSLGIVQDHGGRIEVMSKEGKGSTFTVWLPVKPLVVAQVPS